VATARKMLHFIWHMLMRGEPYRYAAPIATHEKTRKLEILAGDKRRKGGVPKGVNPQKLTQSKRRMRQHEHDRAKIAQAQYEELVRLRTGTGVN